MSDPQTAIAAPGRPAHPPRVFFAIEGLRGIGILVVLLFHSLGATAERVLPGGYFVVDFFYAVSGFVLSHAYQARLDQDLSGLGFMKLRLIRIYPLYLVALLISASVNLALLGPSLSEPKLFLLSLVTSALLIPLVRSLAWHHHHPYPFNGTTWTLFWELVVNLIWSTLGPRLTRKWLALFVIVGIALLIVAISMPAGLERGGAFETFGVGGLRVVYGYFGGVAAYRLWASGRLAWLRLPFWASALVLIAIFTLRPAGGNPLFDLIAVLVMPVLAFASTVDPPTRLVPLCSVVGRITYAIYILNFPILLALEQGLSHSGMSARLPGPVFLVLFLSVTAGSCYAADRWFDHPVRKILLRRFAPRNRGHVPGDRPHPPSLT